MPIPGSARPRRRRWSPQGSTPIWRDVPFFNDLVAQHGSEEAAFRAMAAMATPLGRYASADDVAGQIVHLLSEESALITGAAVVMDGGYSL